MAGGHRFGAGRPKQHHNVEDFRSIDIRRISRERMLRPGSWTWRWRDAETGDVVASVTVEGAEDAVGVAYVVKGCRLSVRVRVVRTVCGYGGSRPWFKCPKCEARVALLYIASDGLACRSCLRLVYSVQSASDISIAWRRARKAEILLGPQWTRPKGMHYSTCLRIQERAHKAMVSISRQVEARGAEIEAMLAKFGLRGE